MKLTPRQVVGLETMTKCAQRKALIAYRIWERCSSMPTLEWRVSNQGSLTKARVGESSDELYRIVWLSVVLALRPEGRIPSEPLLIKQQRQRRPSTSFMQRLWALKQMSLTAAPKRPLDQLHLAGLINLESQMV
ncbi:hypothetical protein [Bradyrhizobium sp. RDI18]|uniref:hypothetical protein n=1 Tax=Bradyrhizobium sp. RDI18 TaxID=3367400 RepID=UPI00371604DD